MNFKKPLVVKVIRIIFGLFILFSGVSGLMAGSSMEGVPAEMIESLMFLKSTGLFHMIKITEVVAGAMLVLNFWPALAAIFIAPIAVGVIVFNAMVAPEFVITGVIVSLLDAYLGYAYWDKYKALFTRG